MNAASNRHTCATVGGTGGGGTGIPDGGFRAHSSHSPCPYPLAHRVVFVPSNLRATFDASVWFPGTAAHALYGLEVNTFVRAVRPSVLMPTLLNAPHRSDQAGTSIGLDTDPPRCRATSRSNS